MRVFVAVPVPAELREKVAGLGKEIALDGVSLVKSDNMHLTLKFIGEVQPQKIDEIKQKLAKVGFKGFHCRIRGVGVFPSPNYVRVVWAGCESGGNLEALAKDVIAALHGFGTDERFTAHLTIARVKKRLDLGAFLKKHEGEEFGSFEVKEFHLIESVLGGAQGPRYNILATFTSSS